MTLPDRASALAVLVTLAVAVGSGAVAARAGLPLPWLLGALLSAAALAVSGVRIAGQAPQFPAALRNVAVPVIGVMIGAGITPEVARAMLGWAPSLLALVPVMVVLQTISYGVLRQLGGYDRPTAFFASSPGGLVEAVLIGEREGGTVALMSLQHLCRVALTVIAVPLIFRIVTGETVGSAAGVGLGSAPAPLGWIDAALLVVSGVAGLALGKALNLPAAIMVGPMLVSALVHVTGLSGAEVPALAVTMAQVVIGLVIGLRFTGQTIATLWAGLRLAVLTVAISLAVAALVALVLSRTGLAGFDAIFLAFAPGGIAEMGLIAISLDVSPVYVTVHHVVRIILAVGLSRLLFRWMLRIWPDP